jgi:hypothetical protein
MRKVVGGVAGVVAVGGAIWSIYTLQFVAPVIKPPEIMIGTNPLKGRFTVSNDEYWTMYNVRPECIIVYVADRSERRTYTWVRVLIEGPKGDISHGDHRQYTCLLEQFGPLLQVPGASEVLFGGVYSHFRIAFVVYYDLWFWPWARKKDVRFHVEGLEANAPKWVEGVPLGVQPSPIPSPHSGPHSYPENNTPW